MLGEFGAIKRLLQSGKQVAQYNKVWSGIHEQTGLGVIMGRQLRFTRAELARLREYGRQLTGLDPQHDTLKGGRMAMADKASNEKLTSDSVFGDLLVLATAGEADVIINETRVQTPPGTVLSVKPEVLGLDELKRQRLLIVENGAIMPAWHEIRLPEPWTNSVILYRGHRENVSHAQNLVAQQPADKLALYYDFDPEGIDLAMRWGKGAIIIPENWRQIDCIEATGHQKVNQRTVFRQQRDRLKRTRAIAKGSLWEAVLDTMEQHEVAIMQEHLTRRQWPLTALPPPAPQSDRLDNEN
jgi:hypothetical protein